jgi:hypothetical protein
MKCEWVQQNVVFYVYDELPDDARHELEQHVARCKECGADLETMRSFRKELVRANPVEGPSPNLLTSSRMKLQEALESAEQGGWWSRLVFDPMRWLNQVRFAPALASAIFILGFAAGIGATYKMVRKTPVIVPPGGEAPAVASISGINSISQQPGSNQVTIKYDTVSPRELSGPMSDTRVQQLLLYAARNNFNAGVRMDSVNLLTQQPSNEHVREALLYALRYDSNAGVRLKALDGLGPYVKDDVRVRDSMLEVLMADTNPGVRIEALHLLEPVRADSSVRIVLERLEKDENRYIRSQARSLLVQLPEMN